MRQDEQDCLAEHSSRQSCSSYQSSVAALRPQQQHPVPAHLGHETRMDHHARVERLDDGRPDNLIAALERWPLVDDRVRVAGCLSEKDRPTGLYRLLRRWPTLGWLLQARTR